MNFIRYLLIINPCAGSAREIEADIVNFFKKHNIILDVKKTKKPLDARRFAKAAAKASYPVVIIAGGDGTINEAINGLANSKVKLGIIPLGTENALAQGFNIPLDYMKAAAVILKCKNKLFDLGKAKNRYFILAAGVGLDAKKVSNIKPVLKKLLGKRVYPLTAVKTVFTHFPPRISVWIDDQVLPRWGYFVIIANVKYYGGNLQVAHFAEPNDGYLDVCIFKRADIINMFRYFISAASKGIVPLSDLPNVEYFKAKQIKISSKKEVLAHTDAELIGSTPLKVSVCPKAIRVIVNEKVIV